MNSIELNKEKIEESIQLIDKLDLSKATIAELENLLTPLFEGYSITTTQFESGIYIQRSIIYNDQKPTLLKGLSYPPSEYITSYGRANDIGQQMFYCSIQKSTPYFEIQISPGDKFVSSLWKTKSPLLLNHVGFTNEIGSQLKSNRILEESYDFIKEMRKFDKVNRLVYNYLATKFSRIILKSNGHLYKLSIAIANKLLMGDTFAGIIYPSLAVAANSDNIVLLPKYVDSNLEFISVEYFQVYLDHTGMQRFETLDTAIEIGTEGKILWTDKYLSWNLPPKSETSFYSRGDEWVESTNKKDRAKPISGSKINPPSTILERTFRDYFPSAFKISNEITLQNNIEKVIVQVVLLLDIKLKSRALAFYLPSSLNPLGISNAILSQYQSFVFLDKGKEIQIRDKKTNNVTDSSKDFNFSNLIYLFSENNFDTSMVVVSPQINVVFEFGK